MIANLSSKRAKNVCQPRDCLFLQERIMRCLLVVSVLCLAGCEGNKSDLGRGVSPHLKRSPDACLPNPCQHQGHCQVEEDGPVCSCKPGFTGVFCQDVIMKLACEEEYMKMMVRKEVFELLKIPRELVHLKNQACKVSEREEEGKLFFAATLTGENHTTCGSIIQQNSSHISYHNVIESKPEARGGVISRSFQLEVHFSCLYAYEQVVKLPFALTAVDKLVQFVVREGHFNVSMRLYKTPSYLQPYYLPTAAIPIMDTLYVLLNLEGQNQIKYFLLSVEDCWATPTADPYQGVRHGLIEKGCPQDETVTYLNAIGESTAAKFSFQMFQFVGYPEVFLHCRVRLCLPGSLEPCAKQCPRHQRSKRALADDYNKIVSYGPIHLLAAPSLGAGTQHSRTDPQDLGGLNPWFLGVLILLCALGVLTAAVVAISTRQRLG
ncbi:pancreatic secretory granule membrane major glycoprotein GP2-like [Heliangelus exortis]|uniref:pancreatic secretory granule membrane major glycoprotein GP2-like n=1 Tax=Heliangelus exortis TaxID=472823 RepID=UPI003A8F2324